MLLVPLSLAQGKSRYRVGKVTEHLKTNLQIVSQIAACKYHILPAEKSHIITIEGAWEIKYLIATISKNLLVVVPNVIA